MFKTRPCGCKGLRSCKICEELYGAFNLQKEIELPKENGLVFCPYCHKLCSGWDLDTYKSHPNHKGALKDFSGVLIIPDFISLEEEEELLKNLDTIPWNNSQSGRFKQNYGPKCNFKKRKVQLGSFRGYPSCTKFIQEKFQKLNLLSSFQTAEQCSLEYLTERGSSIDPHIDDCWIWGERIPTLSLVSDSVLTLTKYKGLNTRYNLPDTLKYPCTVDTSGKVKNRSLIEKELKDGIFDNSTLSSPPDSPDIVRVPMPRRSLLILYGAARYDYEHCILREDVFDRRVCITYRELTPLFFRDGPYEQMGQNIEEIAKVFCDPRELS